jgi:hypothetical protein
MSIESIEQALRRDLPHHWAEGEATVTDCTFAHARDLLDGGGVDDELAHYAVGFTYQVNGKTYTGVLSSPVEVEAGDTFAIRYNPRKPEQNNSLASELNRPWFKEYTYIFVAVIIGLLLYGVFQQHIFHR